MSAGNAAAVGVADYLDFYADDPATAVGLAYVEGIADGRGASSSGSAAVGRAQAARAREGRRHRGRRSGPRPATPARWPPTTGSSTACAARPASPGRPTVEEAFEAAATFATQPLPTGPNVVVLTTAGGWGVVTADAITRDRDLALLPLPDDLRAAHRRASCRPAGAATTRSTCAGGETRDTIPEVHASWSPRTPTSTPSSTSASASSRTRPGMMRDGPLLPGPRPRAHRRLPRAPGRAASPRPPPSCRADAASRSSPPPSWPSPTRTTPARPRSAPPGGSATPRRNRAVTALGHLYRYARWRRAPRAPESLSRRAARPAGRLRSGRPTPAHAATCAARPASSSSCSCWARCRQWRCSSPTGPPSSRAGRASRPRRRHPRRCPTSSRRSSSLRRAPSTIATTWPTRRSWRRWPRSVSG